jgi:transposase
MSTHILKDMHTIEQLVAYKKQSRDEDQKLRLRAIINLKRGKGVNQVADELVTTRRSISTWVRKYNTAGISGLQTNKGGRPEGNPIWNTDMFDELTKHIADTGGYWSVPTMQGWIEKKYHKTIPQQTIWYHLCLKKFSYKSSRPHPYKGNREQQELFKKGA